MTFIPILTASALIMDRVDLDVSRAYADDRRPEDVLLTVDNKTLGSYVI